MPRRTATTSRTWPSRLLDRFAALATFTLLMVVPLIWSVQSTSPFRAPKSALATLCWIALGVVLLARTVPTTDWIDAWWLPWLALIAAGAISATLSKSPAQVLLATAALLPPALAWGALRQLDRKAQERLVSMVIVAGALQAVLTLAFLTPQLRPASFGDISDGRELWLGTLGNPGDVAMFLVLPALLALDHALARTRHRAANAAAAVVMATVIASSQSLSGTLALGAGSALLAWQRVPRRRLLQGAAVGALVAAVLVAATPLRTRVVGLVDQFQRGRWMWVGSGRLAGYQAALGMLEDSPLVGVGLGLYGSESFRFQNEWTLAFRARELGLVTGFGEAHNDALQYAAETGLIGLVLLLAAGVAAVRKGPKEPPPPFAWLPLAAAAGILVLFQFPLHLSAIAAQWLVLLAVTVPPIPKHPVDRSAPVLRVAVVALLSLGAAAGAWRYYRATVALQQGKILVTTLRAAPDGRRRREIASRALNELEGRRPYLPFSWDLELTLGNLAMVSDDAAAALQHFRAALARGERPETHFNIGMALAAVGDRAGAMSELERAVRLNPAIFKQITNADLSLALRDRLDRSGYGARVPWIYRGTPAEGR